jgi:hypothetical protein
MILSNVVLDEGETMANLVLSSKQARTVVDECSDDYTVVHTDLVEEWRWGVLYETIVKDAEGNLWGVTYRVQTGDSYYHEFEDLDEVEFYPVKAVEKTVITYQRA